MHTIDELDASDFAYVVAEERVSRETVLPPITPQTRLGVVMDAGVDGLGAGTFILSCVIAFYDRLREQSSNFMAYPDFYTFQLTTPPTDYHMLDIYPQHKNVGVHPGDESLLQAITDRAISILLVPDVSPTPPAIEDITRASAQRTIDACYAYAVDSRLEEPTVSIRLPREPVADWFETTAQSSDTRPCDYSVPEFGSSDSKITQHYRRLSLDQALKRLPT